MSTNPLRKAILPGDEIGRELNAETAPPGERMRELQTA
jgi:hypothetical protein